MNDYQKTIAEHQNELQIYKAEVQRLNDMLEHQSARRDELLLKDRERELKRVRNELEEARDEIVFKDKKTADLELERVRLLNEIKTARAEREKAGSII
jgi:chromosome segregation ATPase